MQLASRAGATVIGTSRSAEKLDRSADLGLDAGIVPFDGAFADDVKRITGGRGADVILDLVGASYFKQNLASLAAKGSLVLVGLTGGSMTEFDLRQALHKRAKIIGTVLRARSVEEKAEATASLIQHSMQHIESGSITPVVASLSERAHQ